MLGDKIVVKEHHTRAAAGVYSRIADRVSEAGKTVAITVAGESGSGKSEIASEIARLFEENKGMRSVIFAQDDYFRLPPYSNTSARRENIENVGMQEVRLDLLDEHLAIAKEKSEISLKKPLVDYDNDKILEEVLPVEDADIVFAEGTYTTSLKNADIRVFIDRTYQHTLEHRKERARDMLDEFTERVLEIEHGIISLQKKEADVIIGNDYNISD